MSVATATYRSRLRPADVLRVGALGLRTRRLRTGLSTLGVAIGIAAMVGVLGLSASSREELQTRIRALGTNLLEVQAGQGFGRGVADTARRRREDGQSDRAGHCGQLDRHRRRDRAANRRDLRGHQQWHHRVRGRHGLLTTLNASLADGEWLDDGNEHLSGGRARLGRRPEARDRRCRRRTARADRRRLVRRHRHPRTRSPRPRVSTVPRSSASPRPRPTSSATTSLPSGSTCAPRKAPSTPCAPCCRRP